MQTRELMTVREYLSTSFRPDCDYVDGEVVERNMGERDHSRMQMAVSGYFYARCKEFGIEVFPYVQAYQRLSRLRRSVRLDSESAKRKRVPLHRRGHVRDAGTAHRKAGNRRSP